MNKFWYLKRMDLLAEIKEEDMKLIDKNSNMITCDTGSIIYSPEELQNNIYFLKSGKVQLYKIDPSGKKIIYTILKEGEVFGALTGQDKENFNEYAEALENATLCVVNKDLFFSIVEKNPVIHIKVNKLLGLRVYELEMFIEDLAFKTVSQRLIALLKRLHDKFGVKVHDEEGNLVTKINISLSHHDIANMIGATREATTKALDELKKKGIIKTGRKVIYIVDSQKLENLVSA